MVEAVTQGFSMPPINTALPYFKETPKFQLLMSLIHRGLQWIMGRIARAVCARPALILALGIALAAGSIFVVSTRFNVVNNTTDLLSDKFEPRRNYNELKADFGSDYRFLVLIKSSD